MMNKSTLPYVLIGLLAQEPMSGYDLKKRIEVSVSNFIKASYGNIYPTLKRLEARKEIIVFDSLETHKKVRYKSTSIGIQRLKKWLVSDIIEDHVFLLRVYFFSFITPEEQITLIKQYYNLLINIQTRYQRIEETYGNMMGEYPYRTLCYGKEMIKAEMKCVIQGLDQEKQ